MSVYMLICIHTLLTDVLRAVHLRSDHQRHMLMAGLNRASEVPHASPHFSGVILLHSDHHLSPVDVLAFFDINTELSLN